STLLLGGIPPSAITPQFAAPTVVEAATQTGKIQSAVNFRTSPSLNSRTLGTIQRGATVKVLKQVNSAWLQIEYKGKRGYISSEPRFISYKSSGQASSGSSSSLSALERKADKIIRDGLSKRGTPYRYGARLGSGYYDCSL